MELRDFAERVLFANSLEEKLAPPAGTLTDADAGPPQGLPPSPGRPPDLVFDQSGERADLPGRAGPRDDAERGRLLHFFANHELLAAELMALALLKFPDAPPAFRAGLARTLREEQMHTRLYLRRLEQCGVPFGSQPVNGFFWKSVSRMETPLDYVARLSLTFEQANLDYSRHFARLFREAGDAETAALLDRIYRDEIGHVRYGLDWFRRWKDPGQSDWAGFRQRLAFPLSPSRAKGGGPYNREGRRKAGLDETFIDQLEVYTQSRGRTPNVYHFNPQAEWIIGRQPLGADVRPEEIRLPKSLQILGEDLSALTLFLARRDDLALVERRPTVGFLLKISRAGWPLPEIRERRDVALSERKLGRVIPWAGSPDSAAFLAPWLAGCTQPGTVWRPAWRELHSKLFSTKLALEGGFGCGHACLGLEEVIHAREQIAGAALLKAPFGVAGKGLRGVPGTLTEPDLAWARDILQREGGLVVEPWHERLLDFSVHYDRDFRLLGYVRLHNDEQGRFRACSIPRPLTEGAGEEVTRFFHGRDAAVTAFYEQTLPRLLRPHLERMEYSGPLGVDALIAREPDGSLRHHPVIEINPRHTMGRVTLELARHVVKGQALRFEILTSKHLQPLGAKSFSELATRLEADPPLRFQTYQNGSRRILSGTLALNDPAHARQFLAVLRVGESAEPLLP